MGDAFLVIGGYAEDSLLGILDTIYKYERESWTELDTKLPFRMENLMAIMVDLDIFPSCSDEEGTSAATSLYGNVSLAFMAISAWIYNTM